MTPEDRAEIEALARQAVAEQRAPVVVPWRVEMLTPLDQPDHGWCVRCQLPSTLEWQVVFELGEDIAIRTYSLCTDCGEESTE